MYLDRRRQCAISAVVVALAFFAVLVPMASKVAGARSLDTSPQPLNAPVADNPLGYVPNQLLVKLAPGTQARVVSGRLAAQDSALSEALDCLGFASAEEVAPGTFRLSAPGDTRVDVSSAAAQLQATGLVTYAGPNHLFHAMLTPNDEQYAAGQQWGVTQIKAEQAWDVTTGSPNIVIAILDTGTATNHPDLSDKIVHGYNFVANSDNPYDDNGHGTYTAGIAAASSNNGRGVTGISWGARIMPVKVLSSNGSGSEEDIARGIHWAVDAGARIINASLGGDIDSPVMRDAVQYAADHNVLLVAAAGNTPDGKPNYPAAYDSVLAVGATGRSDTYTGFSSWGPYVDVTAPGVGILSTGWDHGNLTYEYGNGTSASCPFVSGVAALVWSVNPQFTAAQVMQIIEDSSDDLGPPGWDEHYGMGRLDAAKAVQMAQHGAPPPHTPTPPGQVSSTPAPTSTGLPIQGPSVVVANPVVGPGGLLSMVGGGFNPNELVDLRLTTGGAPDKGIGNVQAGPQGQFRADVGVPLDAAPGKATLTAVGEQSGKKASADITIAGGQSRVQGTIKGSGSEAATVKLAPAQGGGPEQTTQANAQGAYSFGNVSAGLYSLWASAPGVLTAGPVAVEVDGSPADAKTIDISLSSARPAAFDRVPPVAQTSTLVYFAPVGHTLGGPFLKFWKSNGGLAIFGYPISEEFNEVSATDGQTYRVQYFERNRFEYHPQFANTPNEVLMGLLGVDLTRGRTFLQGQPFVGDSTHVYFNETHHSLQGPFLKYWQTHGGLAVFGYPISEEIVEASPTDGKQYTVQYFQRNRFELHPEFANTPNEVLLGLLGVETAKQSGWTLR